MKFLSAFLLLCMSALCLIAGQFKSTFFSSTNDVGPIPIADNELMVIRNFTQDGPGTSRGYAVFNHDQGHEPIKILAASIVDSASPEGSQEVINSVIVAGPGRVRFHCGDAANCFVTFKIDSN